MIADVLDICAVAQEEPCSAASTIPNCSFVKVKMQLLLRGDELNMYVTALLAEFFPEGKNLKDEIGLPVILTSLLHSCDWFYRKAPSAMPSWQPSLSPSDYPTILASANPSALVPEPTKKPSESPSKTPSATPSSAPTPTPPPTLASVPGETPSPTETSSATPSSTPSVAPAVGSTPSP
ncbi:unnamed protein product [Cylindrotheca closterium]|uniref:Uncharacterized protein n=2 Tax=Cylindrotheca closterium TaxID=2856 RepID=A0AAD2GD92_9STRA|nr:unnamed protein product [Cylindrotheca closterium]